MTSNFEQAVDLIADATAQLGASVARGMDRAILAAEILDEAGLLVTDDLIAEKKAHAELRAWVESLYSRVDSVGGGAVTFHKANFLDEITRVLEGDNV